jgi:hypothetical protein
MKYSKGHFPASFPIRRRSQVGRAHSKCLGHDRWLFSTCVYGGVRKDGSVCESHGDDKRWCAGARKLRTGTVHPVTNTRYLRRLQVPISAPSRLSETISCCAFCSISFTFIFLLFQKRHGEQKCIQFLIFNRSESPSVALAHFSRPRRRLRRSDEVQINQFPHFQAFFPAHYVSFRSKSHESYLLTWSRSSGGIPGTWPLPMGSNAIRTNPKPTSEKTFSNISASCCREL